MRHSDDSYVRNNEGRGKRKGRLAVVDPEDATRSKPNRVLEKALSEYDCAHVKDATAMARLADRMWEISTKMMVAIRDPHPDDAAIAEIRNWFESTFGCCITTNLYMSGTTDCVGFIEHHDNHDVFAMQLHGVKRWFVGPPIVGSPSHRYYYTDSHTTPRDELTCYETHAGEMLYIPVGWRHYALPGTSDTDSGGGGGSAAEAAAPRAQGTNSVHLTMGVQVPRWVDALESAPHLMGAWEAWLREPLPAAVASHNSDIGSDGGKDLAVCWDASNLAAKLRELADCVEKSTAVGGMVLETGCGGTMQVAKHGK